MRRQPLGTTPFAVFIMTLANLPQTRGCKQCHCAAEISAVFLFFYFCGNGNEIFFCEIWGSFPLFVYFIVLVNHYI